MDGSVFCESGLAKELGFGNGIIHQVDMNDAYFLGDTVNADVTITKTGEDDICMLTEVYDGDSSNANNALRGFSTIL